MNDADDRIVIVGGGLAAVRTAQALRDLHFPGAIALLSAESVLPYDRPPLSKGYLLGTQGDDQVRLLSAEKLAELRIEVRLDSHAIALDRTARCVRLSDGGAVGYARVVVATGARPARLPMLEAFDNVHVLRDAKEARRLREALGRGKRVGIVGAGFIGLEIAATALAAGCDVTMIESAPTPLAAILGTELGACVRGIHERKGIRFHCGVGIAGVCGSGSVSSLQLTDGVEIDVDEVVIGVGQIPNVDWLANSGLALQRGLLCDVHGRTEDPHVFGVGDAVCTRVGDSLVPTRQWTAVTEQARRCAAALIGDVDPGPVIADNYFWSDQHGLRLQFAGRMPTQPRLVWVKGEPEADRFAVLCCEGEEVAAVFSVGCPRDFVTHAMPLRRGERATAALS